MNNISKFLFFFFIFILLLSVSNAHALGVPAPDGYVRDDAKILTEFESTLEQRLQQLEKDTSVEIAILTIPSLEGEEASLYAGNVFDTWKIGQADVDNGLLILVAANDRKYFFQTGYGLEGTLPDIALGRMGREILVPLFREEKYGEGINAVISEIESFIRNDPSVVSKYEEKPVEFELFGLGFSIVALWGILILLAAGKSLYFLRKKPNGIVQTIQQTVSLVFMSGWLALLSGFITMFIIGGFYGFTLISIGIILLILLGTPPYFSESGGGGFIPIGFGSGGFGGGGGGSGGFGGGSSGGGGAGGGW